MTIKKLQKICGLRSKIDICLESLKLVQISDKYTNSKKSIASHIITTQSKMNFSPIFSKIHTTWQIFNLGTQEKHQIADILSYCSSTYSGYRCNKKRATQKYLGRFIYRYSKQFMSILELVINNKDKNLKEDYAAATIALYIIHKILKASDQFSNCRKFK